MSARSSTPSPRSSSQKETDKKGSDKKSDRPSEKKSDKPRRQREPCGQFAHKVAQEANRAPLIHFPQGKLAPPPKEDKHAARDQHDVANLLVLPVIVAAATHALISKSEEAYRQLFVIVLSYFVIDFAWVILIPSCVKSTFTIKMHHIAALLYLIVPYTYPEYGHFFGYAMLLELNTWFLIARRFWNRSYKWHSVGFYITWITIRLGLFTYLLYEACMAYYQKVFSQLDMDHSGALSMQEGLVLRNWVHLMMLAPMLQALFCALNYKWTYDLVLQKWRDKGPSQGL